MKRIYLAIVALLGLIMSLAACGSSGSSGSGSSSSSSSGGSDTVSSASSAATSADSSASTGASSSAPPASGGSIVIGSAAFPESELLANIYAEALKAKGVKATTKLDIGERAIYIKALDQGSIDFFPEYSGSILNFLDPKTTAKTPTAVYAALQKAAGSKLTVFKTAPAQDSDTITVTKATASKYHLSSIADLAPVASKLTFGAPAQFQTRPDGIPALKSVYGVTFGRFTKLGTAGSITVNALKNGSIDAADIFSTDSSIAKNGFVSLKDPKSMFAAQNIVPLVNKAKATPAIKADCDAVSAKLDTKTLASLVAKVSNGNSNEVAKTWLKSVGLG